MHHSYDAMGRLSRFFASDGSFSYAYRYDKNSRPLAVVDEKNGGCTERIYDANGHLVKETLGNGLSMRYSYDRMGRPLQEILDDGSSIAFSYDSFALKKVARVDVNSKELYSHIYGERDLSGQLMSAFLIGGLGQIDYRYDVSLRLVEVKSP